MLALRWLPLLLVTAIAQAGHGLINSFAGIEWLPDPGLSPDSPAWRVERWGEAFEIWRARAPAARIALWQAQARERLAEAVAMVRVKTPEATRSSLAAYVEILDLAIAEREVLAQEARLATTLALATRMLEDQYLVTTEYLDLPRGARTVLMEAVLAAAARYADLKRELPRRTQESLFFREEEVRWSREQALGADAQGL